MYVAIFNKIMLVTLFYLIVSIPSDVTLTLFYKKGNQ